MTKLMLCAIALCAIGVSVTGCGPRKPTPSAGELRVRPGAHLTNEVSRALQDLRMDDVLVQVGGRRLTKKALSERVAERVDLEKSNAIQPLQQAMLDRVERSARRFLFVNFMARAAMLEEAAERGVEPTEQDLKDAEAMINQISRRLKIKRADFARRFEGGEAEVQQRIREEATLQAVIRDEFGSFFEETDRQAAALQEELKRLRNEAMATNAVFAACLEEARKRLISEEWAETGGVYVAQSELPQNVAFGGIVRTQAMNFDFPQARAAIEQLRIGEWSPVVELDESFDLYQLREIEPDEDKDLVVYTYARFSAPRDIGWEVPDIAQLKRDIGQQRRKERQTPWVRGLMTKFGVLYPNGVELFGETPPAKPEADSSARKERRRPQEANGDSGEPGTGN